LSEN
jgi:hypothetical protein